MAPGCRRQRFSGTVLCTFCVLSRCNPCVILAHTLLNLKTGFGRTLSASGDSTCHQRQDTSLQLWGFHWLHAPAAVPQNECPALTSPRCWWGLGVGKNHLVSNQNSGKFSFSGRFWSQRYSHDAWYDASEASSSSSTAYLIKKIHFQVFFWEQFFTYLFTQSMVK